MTSQIFKNKIPIQILIDFLDKACEKHNNVYKFDKISYKKSNNELLLELSYSEKKIDNKIFKHKVSHSLKPIIKDNKIIKIRKKLSRIIFMPNNNDIMKCLKALTMLFTIPPTTHTSELFLMDQTFLKQPEISKIHLRSLRHHGRHMI